MTQCLTCESMKGKHGMPEYYVRSLPERTTDQLYTEYISMQVKNIDKSVLAPLEGLVRGAVRGVRGAPSSGF